MMDLAHGLIELIEQVGSREDLGEAMTAITRRLGFEFFALTHHVDVQSNEGDVIHLHNYPERWAEYYDSMALGLADPVHRAAHVTSVGFRWSQLEKLIALEKRDLKILDKGKQQGIGDGFTVPANVPGEARGSCTFANRDSSQFPEAMMPLAQLIGAFAFEAARRLWIPPGELACRHLPRLTPRQRDCVLWVARGKTDWEVSRILGIEEDTVTRHIKMACERYGVNKRTLLAVRTLFNGTLSFSEIVARRYTPFRE